MDVLVDFEGWLNNPCFANQFGAKAKDIILSENYRSTTPILDAANSLIDKNNNRVKKSLFTTRQGGDKVQYFHARNDKEEIQFIMDKMKEHQENGGKFSDFAVLYRSNYVSRFVEQGFLSANIPYVVYGGIGFYERAEIRDVLSYMRLVNNTEDDLAFGRIINTPRRKIGKKKIAAIKVLAEETGRPMYDALKELCDTDLSGGVRRRSLCRS